MKKINYKNINQVKRFLIFASLAFVFLTAIMVSTFAGGSQSANRKILLLDIKGVINPFSAKYILRGIGEAERGGAQLVVIQMDTPGGLDTSMREIDSAILNSSVPVAVFVGPKGARAASAGVFITYCSDIAAMAPGTNIGAAHPVNLGGGGSGGDDQSWIKKLLEMYEEQKKKEEQAKKPEAKPSVKLGEQPSDKPQTPQQPAIKPQAPKEPATKPEEKAKPSLDDAQAMMEKITNDAVAYIKAIADLKGRNSDWGEKAVRDAVSITSTEALKIGVIEYLAKDVNDLLKQINGVTINKNDRTYVLETIGAPVEEVPMSAIENLMLMITNPQVAYLLFIIGLYGLIYELAHPGAIFPGVVGGISIVLAILAFNYLPITAVGVILILLGIAFMVAEIKVPGLGMLAFGGVLCFVLGSFLLIDRNYGEMVIRPATYLPMAALSIVLIVIVIPRIWAAMKRQVATGVGGIIGNVGIVTTELHPLGKIHVHGEYWDARSDDGSQIPKGAKIVVLKKDSEEMRLIVKRKEDDWHKSNMPEI